MPPPLPADAVNHEKSGAELRSAPGSGGLTAISQPLQRLRGRAMARSKARGFAHATRVVITRGSSCGA